MKVIFFLYQKKAPTQQYDGREGPCIVVTPQSVSGVARIDFLCFSIGRWREMVGEMDSQPLVQEPPTPSSLSFQANNDGFSELLHTFHYIQGRPPRVVKYQAKMIGKISELLRLYIEILIQHEIYYCIYQSSI